MNENEFEYTWHRFEFNEDFEDTLKKSNRLPIQNMIEAMKVVKNSETYEAQREEPLHKVFYDMKR